MVGQTDGGDEAEGRTRRELLSSVAAAGAAAAGIGAFAGSATAWRYFAVDFRGCSEVRVVADESAFTYAVADGVDPLFVRVVVELDGTLACREVPFTEETRYQVPRVYDGRPVVRYAAPPEETIVGVIQYNRRAVATCWERNTYACAELPDGLRFGHAPCFADLAIGENYTERPCDATINEERWVSEGPPGRSGRYGGGPPDLPPATEYGA